MRAFFILCLALMTGCATSPVYNPVTAATQQTFLLNESALAQVKMGMKETEVRQIMGDDIIIGYTYQKPLSSEKDIVESTSNDYKPLTIANPYKTEDITTKEGTYKVEYYVSSIRQPDGVVTDSELVPLIFHNGLLTGRGWDDLKALRSQNPS